ncbi:hypothetical protein [Aquabacterium sp. J223]|uniref:hypothetical protein n=1 Tax=Aquabacterium sp. J223 TaxID=2898431 RepID=UPI0021AD5464|nr:hypothetical protein [Aquabacterium sp. J223]UUX95054.1 hypothetical protein LRS07_17680 [Aquabacterium sp. J223]
MTWNPTPATPARLAPSRREALRVGLPEAVDLLHRRQAARLDEVDLDDYVSLRWLEWHGGGLRLTTAGQALCDRLQRP